MAKKSLKNKCESLQNERVNALAKGKTMNFPTRVYNRCKLCGRVGGYMRRFELCRICFREYASKGQIPGVKKASW